MAETNEYLVLIHNARTLESAIRGVVEKGANYLSSKLNIRREEGFMLISAAGDVMLCQACKCPIDVVTRLRIPKAIFPNSIKLP
jgi:acetamidase/formamidase